MISSASSSFGKETMKHNNYLKPQPLGWVHDAHTVNTGVYSWGIATDPVGVMIAGIFAGRKTALAELGMRLSSNQLTIPLEEKNLSFEGFGREAYRIFDQNLPDGQGAARLYLHRGLTAEDPVESGGMLFFYVWGHTRSAPDFDLWAARMQDIHRLPVRKSWYPCLWDKMLYRGWVQRCTTYGFAPLWEVSVTTDEWQAMIIENLDQLERRVYGPAC